MSNRRASGLKMGGGQSPTPNTFIGGVGASYITSPADYVALTTGLALGDIKSFTIDVDNNVSFYVDLDYEVLTLFCNTTEITYFIDVDSKINIFTDGFRNSTNLKYLYAKGITEIATNRFSLTSLTSLLKINLFGLADLEGRNAFLNMSQLKKLELNSAITATQNNALRVTYKDFSSLERLNINALSTMAQGTLHASMIGKFFSGMPIGCKIYYNVAFGIQNRNSFNYITAGMQIGDKYHINSLIYEIVANPTVDGDVEYDSNQSLMALNFSNVINADSRIGSDYQSFSFQGKMLVISNSVGSINNFTTTKDVSNVGIAEWSYSTLIGGNDVHPLLINAREKDGSILIEVNNIITVNPPTLLTLSNQTSTTVDINFTPPTANANGTDGYEVWIDDGTAYRKWFEFTEITASGDTIDISNLENISGSIIKIRTFDGHYNFSEFTSEVTLT